MITIKNQTNPVTQQWINEQFGTATCAAAFGPTTLRSAVVVTKGHVGLAMRDLAYTPGTTAWSPPPC